MELEYHLHQCRSAFFEVLVLEKKKKKELHYLVFFCVHVNNSSFSIYLPVGNMPRLLRTESISCILR